MSEITQTILPCPFCDSVDVVLFPNVWAFVRCRRCNARGPQHFHSELLEDYKTGNEDAVSAWNALSEELQKLRNVRQEVPEDAS